MSHHPPRFILRLFKPFVRSWIIEDIEGDLNELYTERVAQKGKFRAGLGYLVDLITMLNMYKTKLKISSNMKSLFFHHLKSTMRGFQRRKEYFFINCAGLVLALGSAILITSYVIQELSYDNFHRNGDRIVRLVLSDGLVSPAQIGPHLLDKVPEFKANTRVSFAFQPLRFKKENTTFNVEDLAFVDEDFFEIFSFPLIQGTEAGLLSSPDQIALSQSEAKKLFGEESALDQLITINDSLNVLVKAVFKDVPKNSHLKFDYLLPMEFNRRMGKDKLLDVWGRFSVYNYYLLGTEDQNEVATEKAGAEVTDLFKSWGEEITTGLQPISDVHFNTKFVNGLEESGDLEKLSIYITAGLLIFIIACINYVNLSAAIVSKRTKEIGVRKVLGAFKFDLMRQYLIEVGSLATLSFLISMLLVKWTVPYFNLYLGHDLEVKLLSETTLILFGAYLIATTFLAGLYPAYLFSGLKPVAALRGKGRTGKKSFRQILVTSQFTFSLILLILTFITRSQIKYINDFDPGYDREGVIVMPLSGHTSNQFKTLKTELLRSNLIESVSSSESMPINHRSTTSSKYLSWEGKLDGTDDFSLSLNWVEESYLDLFKMNLKAGRSFSEVSPEGGPYYIVNEKAVAQMGLEDPVGQKVGLWSSKGEIVGVVEDFNFQSVRSGIEPMLLILESNIFEMAFIRYQKGNPVGAIEAIEEIIRTIDPNYTSNLVFMDSEFQEMYLEEQRTNALLTVFSSLAIVISIMGLFGFITFVVQSRLKEVSIRKVLGASGKSLVNLISKEFAVMLTIAALISWPIAYWLSESWLADFEYRIATNWLLFIASTIILLMVTFGVIGGQLLKVIRTNPTNVLRSE